MAVCSHLDLVCCLMCICVHVVAGNSTNCTTNPYVEPRMGKRLPVSIIANVTAKTIQFCASICLRRSSCRSFNYNLNSSDHQCQLNEFDFENNTIDDPNYVYSSINDWNLMMVYSCANHSCSEDYICLPTLSHNYTCLQLHIQCGPPRSVESTNDIQWPYNKRYKNEIKYICKPGYKYLGGNTKSICQLNMTWSEPSINCSKISCGNPPKSKTTHIISFNESSVGDIVEYSCIKDTILKSKYNFSVCSSVGNWSEPPECGYCDDNKNVTYLGRKICYVRSPFGVFYGGLPKKKVLIASEQSVVDLFEKEAKSRHEYIHAGFQVNATVIQFVNQTIIDRSLNIIDLGDCTKGICVYDKNGTLTNMPSSKNEAIYYTIYDPRLWNKKLGKRKN